MRVRSLIVVGALACLMPAVAQAEDVEDAVQAARAGAGAAAVQTLQPLAERGSAAAQYALGVIYANGDGVAADYTAAARWFADAAKGGHAEARRHLSFMRQVGLIAADSTAADFRIQVASVPGEADAAREWRRLQRRYPEILGPLQVAVVPFEGAGGDKLYKVQGGPLAEEEARTTCARLRAEGAGCLVVTP